MKAVTEADTRGFHIILADTPLAKNNPKLAAELTTKSTNPQRWMELAVVCESGEIDIHKLLTRAATLCHLKRSPKTELEI